MCGISSKTVLYLLSFQYALNGTTLKINMFIPLDRVYKLSFLKSVEAKEIQSGHLDSFAG